MAVGFTNVTATHLQDATGTSLGRAYIWFEPISSVTFRPIPFRTGGVEGVTIYEPVQALVEDGAFSINLADTSLTTPVDIGYKVWVEDLVSGKHWNLYGCFQPTGAVYDFDDWAPNDAPLVTVQYGPQGQPGIPGGIAGTMFDAVPGGTINGTNTTFTLPASPAILLLLKNGLAQTQGVDYTLVGSVVTFLAVSVPSGTDTLRAVGITPSATSSTSTTTATSLVLSDQSDGFTYSYISQNGQLTPNGKTTSGSGVSALLFADVDGSTYSYVSKNGQLTPGGIVTGVTGVSSLVLLDSDGNTYTYVSRYGQLTREA